MNTATTAFMAYWPYLLRYSLALILIGVGALKFTQHEAEAIRLLAEKSIFLSWSLKFLGTRSFSVIIGITEAGMGILIALAPVWPRLSLVGSLGATITFCIILSFMVSSPGLLHKGLSVPFVRDSPRQFLITHALLLCASLWTAWEALSMARNR